MIGFSGKPCLLTRVALIMFSMKIPSGKLSHNYGKSPFLMGKSTISMAIFNSYPWLSSPPGPYIFVLHHEVRCLTWASFIRCDAAIVNPHLTRVVFSITIRPYVNTYYIYIDLLYYKYIIYIYILTYTYS